MRLNILRIMKINTIQGKIIFYSGMAVLLTSILLIVIFQIAAKNSLSVDIENRLQKKAELVAYSFEKLNKKISTIGEIAVLVQKSGLYGDRNESDLFLKQILLNNKELFSTCLIIDDNIKYSDTAKVILGEPIKYYFRDEGNYNNIHNVNISEINSKYYKSLKENTFNGCYITEPLIQKGISVIQYITPIIINNEWKGAILFELKASFIESVLLKFDNKNTDYFLLSRDNQIIIKNDKAESLALYNIINGQVSEKYENYFFKKEIIKTGSWMIYLICNSDDIDSEINYIFYMLVGLGIITVVIGFVGLYYVSKQIIDPIRTGSVLCGEILEGKLINDRIYKDKDESTIMLTSLQNMGQKVTTIFSRIKHLVLEVKLNSDDLHISYKMQEKNVEGFRKQADNISISITEINSKAAELLNVIEIITTKSQSTFKSVSEGATVLIPLANKIKEFADSTEQNTLSLEKLFKDSIKINTVITTINKIAEKTNMLALNATIEAEKAGDFGDGFALVAAEIRKLSTQINNSIYEIELIIDEIKIAVSQALEETKAFLGKTENNANRIDDVVNEVDELVIEIEKLMKQFSFIKDKIEGQSSANKELKTIIQQLNSDVMKSVDNLSTFNKSNNLLDNAVDSLREI